MHSYSYRNLTINALLLMVIAAIVEMILHELGHFFCALYFHASALSLHHNYVNFDENSLSIFQRIWIAAAGPIISLCIGVIFHFIVTQQKSRNYFFLFNCYFAGHGYIGFFGYLMIAPIAAEGDTGFIMHQLKFPVYITIVIALIATLILRKFIQTITKYIMEFATLEIYQDAALRKKYAKSVLLYPIYLGLIIIILMNLPVPIWISLMAPFSIFSFFFAFGEALKKDYTQIRFNTNDVALFKIQLAIIVSFVLVLIINRLLV